MFTRYPVLPYRLRLWLFFKIHQYFPGISGDNIALAYNRKIKLDLKNTDIGHRLIIFTGLREVEITRRITKLAKKGGIMVDVGANYGYFSCLWAAARPNNKVIAFEAAAVNLKPLQNNICKNDLKQRVLVEPMAMGKEKGRLKFTNGGDANQTGWGGFVVKVEDASPEVDVDTLDNYAIQNNIDCIDVLKIDTEGADTWVLYGAQNLLRQKKIKHIFFEHNLHRMGLLGISTTEAEQFLTRLNYKVIQTCSDEFYACPQA